MNKINNKDLYQILGVNEDVSQEQINSLVLKTSPKDNSRIGKALMVLSEPTKRKEYDRIGWKSEWDSEFDKWLVACHSTFEVIHSHLGYGQKEIYHPDGEKIWIGSWQLDSSLWLPFNSPSTDANWIDKIYSIIGENWRGRMEDYKNKMLAAINQVREKKQKTPFCEANWDYVNSGNCVECGKTAKIRSKGEQDNSKLYCSQECYFNGFKSRYKVPKYEIPASSPKNPRSNEYMCAKCHYKGYDCYEMEDESYRCKSCFNGELEKLKNPKKFSPNGNKKWLCDKCQGIIGETGYGSVDNHGNHRSFCSKNCSDTFSEPQTWKSVVIIKRNAFIEILKWMEKQGIESIRFDRSSGQLLVEYSGKIEKPVEEKDLTPELKEIKDYYQENSENTKPLSRELIQAEINKSGGEPKNESNGMLIAGLLAVGAIIFVLIGVIFHKKRTRKY